jgi:hypothetical protein
MSQSAEVRSVNFVKRIGDATDYVPGSSRTKWVATIVEVHKLVLDLPPGQWIPVELDSEPTAVSLQLELKRRNIYNLSRRRNILYVQLTVSNPDWENIYKGRKGGARSKRIKK